MVRFKYYFRHLYYQSGNLLIDSMLIETPVSEFLDNITASDGASVSILDADQMPLTL